MLPLLLSKHARIVLHASAVSTPRGAVAFLAGPGAGKSTLAAGLGRLGWPLIADDALLVEPREGRLLAVPSYPGVRLWPEVASQVRRGGGRLPLVAHYTQKRRLTPQTAGVSYRRRAQGLARLYVLARRGAARAQPAVSRLTRRDAFIELVKFSFCLETQSRDRLARQFERLSHDAGAVTVRRLSVPGDLSKIDGARDAIFADLTGDG